MSYSKLKIVVYPLFFIVSNWNNHTQRSISYISSKLKSYKFSYNYRLRRYVREPDKDYYVENEAYIVFPIGVYKMFWNSLSFIGITEEQVELIHVSPTQSKKAPLKFNPKFVPRDDQQLYIDALINSDSLPIQMVDLATGKGKTMIVMSYVHHLGIRTGFLVLPKYMDKWKDDLKKYTNVKDDEICIIQGLDKMLSLFKNPPKAKYYLFSLTTFGMFLTKHENGTLEEEVDPYELFPKLGVTVLVNDETHQHFHMVTRVMLHSNVSKFIGMSATLDSNRQDINSLYNLIIPDRFRVSKLAEYEPYVNVKAIHYYLKKNWFVKVENALGYSHNQYEQIISRNGLFTKSYFEMIYHYLDEGYLQTRREGDRALIFCASIKLCTMLTAYLKKRLPKLDIRRYVEDDPYENIMEADICVSTNLSSGTAIDIPNLIAVYMTVSMRSLQANKQTLGRLREIKGREVWYYYFYSTDVPKQVQMHVERRETIKKSVKTYLIERYPKILQN